MVMAKQRTSLFNALRVLGDEITSEKQAAANGTKKKADESSPGVDPGGHQGKSTHPSADADNGTQAASEGARSAENEKDVKSDVGPPSVNNNSTVPKQDAVQLGIGMHQSATGEDPKVEDDYKDRLPDPGGYQGPTTHPATTGGEKYGSFKFAELHALQTNIANDLLADIANGYTAPKTAAAKSPAATQQFDQLAAEIEKLASVVDKNVAGNPEAAAAIAAGYHMAASLGIDKTAAQREVAAVIEEAIKDAHFDADLFGHAFIASQELLRKHAAGESSEGEDHNKPADSSSGANRSESASGAGGATDAAAAGASAGGGGEDYASLGELLGGGGGGAPGGAPGAPGGGQPSREEILTELVSALQELGIPIDQLAAAGGGGAAGGAPPMPPSGGAGPMIPPPDAGGGMMPPDAGGGMMPPPPDAGGGMPPAGGGGMPPPGMPPDEGMKLARACRHFQLSGKYRLKTANDNTRERELRDRLKNYVLEVIRR